MIRALACAALLISCAGCRDGPAPDPGVLVVAMSTGPNNLDPRVALDVASQKIGDLISDSLF